MRNFFSPKATEYLTPLPADSASPFPQEYDETSEKEMQFLRNSSLHTRGDPVYEDVMAQTELHVGPLTARLLAPISWLFNYRPFVWIKTFVQDVIIATRLNIYIRSIVSNVEVLENPHVKKEIERLVEEGAKDPEHPVTREEIMERAKKIIDRMAARQRVWTLRIFYTILTVVFRKLFHTVHVDKHGLQTFKEYLKKQEDGVGVVFLPTHKSHIDYLVLSFVAALHEIPVPIIAAGDNLNFPIVGALFRYSGAFFMRRALGGDTLYRAILEGYLDEVLRSGSTLEFFIEGGRSRDGTILPPKYGLLTVILDAVKTHRLKDVVLVPIAVDYDHCPDINSYVKYMMGGKKKKESLTGLLTSASSILSTDCGDAFVTFGTPMSLNELLSRMEHENASLDDRDEVKYVGAHVCQGMRNNSVITTSTLVAAAVMDFPAEDWIPEAELTLRIEAIQGWLRGIGAFEGYSGHSAAILHQFVQNYPELVEVKDKQYRAVQGVKEQITLFYCRNGLLHHFLADAVVLHVFRAMQVSSDRSDLSVVDVVPAVEMMCRVMGAHIPFNVVISAPAIDSLVKRGILSVDQDILTLNPEWEQYTHFCVSLVAPLVDSLCVVLEAMKNLRRGTNEEEVDLTVFLLKTMEMTHAVLKAGESSYPFIANTQMLRNNVDGLVAAGKLAKRREGNTYYIRWSDKIESAADVDILLQSIENLTLKLEMIPVSMQDNHDLHIMDEMIGLMVDVNAKKGKGKARK